MHTQTGAHVPADADTRGEGARGLCLQECAYKVRSSEFYAMIQQGLRARKSAVDILSYEGMKDKFNAVKDFRVAPPSPNSYYLLWGDR
jgi:hypothetical protein